MYIIIMKFLKRRYFYLFVVLLLLMPLPDIYAYMNADNHLDNKNARNRKTEEHAFDNGYIGYTLRGGYTLGTDVGVVGAGMNFGYKSFSSELGVSWYPGIHKKEMREYIGTIKDIRPIGVNAGLLYSLLFQNWHLSLGGGFTWFYATDGGGASSSTDQKKKIAAFIPGFQTWLNWHLINPIFIRVGYRCDFYPENYRNFFINSGRESKGILIGNSLMFGILITPYITKKK